MTACKEEAVFDSYGGYTGISQDATEYFTPGMNHFHTTRNTDYGIDSEQ